VLTGLDLSIKYHRVTDTDGQTTSCNKLPRPTQPPTLCGTGNEYQPECDNDLLLVSKGRRGSFYLWMHVWMAGKTVTRAIPERFVVSQNQSNCYTNILFTLQNMDRWSHWAILWRCGKNHRCKNFEI